MRLHNRKVYTLEGNEIIVKCIHFEHCTLIHFSTVVFLYNMILSL